MPLVQMSRVHTAAGGSVHSGAALLYPFHSALVDFQTVQSGSHGFIRDPG